MTEPCYLVTGATGMIGPHVLERLRHAGYRTHILVRRQPSEELLSSVTKVFLGDIADRDAVRTAMAGCSHVIHLAALLHITDPPRSLQSSYQRTNVEATALVIEEALGANVQRVVYASTIAVYGNAPGRVFTEAATPNPDTVYAETKLQGEKIVLAAQNADGQPLGVVLRFAAVYGPRVQGNYRRLVHSLARGRFVSIGGADNYRTLIYADDLADAVVLAASHPTAPGKTYNVTDGEFHTVDEIVNAICNALGRKPPRITLPVWPVRGVAEVLETTLNVLGRKSPITRSTIDKYTESIMVDGSLIQRELAYQARYSLENGWRHAINEMKQRGEL